MIKDLDNFITETMILIPEGTELIRRFKDEVKWISSNSRMGIPSKGHNQTQTVESVVIKSFQVAKYPVTNQIYDLIAYSEVTNETSNHLPKVDISWYDAILFCNMISRYFGLTEYYSLNGNDSVVLLNPDSKGFRLPTEAEWQYACKAGSNSYQYSDIDEIAWNKANSNNSAHNIGEKRPNEWGLYDTLGNVWEWCWDLFNVETYGSYRIFRGGSFAEEGRICGSTTRRKSHPKFAIDDLGFRLARSV